MDLATLSATAVSILLPYVGKSAEAFAQGIGKSLWERIQSVFTSDREKNDLKNFEEDPELYQDVIRRTLEVKLNQDLDFAKELERLLKSVNSGGDIIYKGGIVKDINATNSTGAIITGYTDTQHIYHPPTTTESPNDPSEEE